MFYNLKNLLIRGLIVFSFVGAWTNSEAALNSDRPSLGISTTGNAVVVWEATDKNRTQIIQAAAFDYKSNTWSEAVKISGKDPAQKPILKVNANGDSVAAWYINNCNTKVVSIEAAMMPAGTAWEAPIVVSLPTEIASIPQLSIDKGGNINLVWASRLASNTPSVVRTATTSISSGKWSTPVTLSQQKG